MPALQVTEAAERLAQVVEKANPSDLAEVYAELFPEHPTAAAAVASDLARHIRNRLEAEEIVDLWNVVFPEDCNVWFDEEAKAIHYNEELIGSVD